MQRFIFLSLAITGCLLTTTVSGIEKSFQSKLKPPTILWIAPPDQRMVVDQLNDSFPVKFTFFSTRFRDLEHHLTDKPLEETQKDLKLLEEKNKKQLEKLINRLKKFDILVLSICPDKFNQKMQEKITSWVQQGGKMIYFVPKWEIIFKAKHALSKIMPVRPGTYKYKAWNTGQDGATDHVLIRGLPVEFLGNYFYGPIYEPADKYSQALTIQRGGRNISPWKMLARFFYKKVGFKGGGVVFIPSRPFAPKGNWNKGSYASYEPERPNDRRVWIDFMKRMFYMLTYGKEAYPILLKIEVKSSKPVLGKQQFELQVKAESFDEKKENSYDITLRISNQRLGTIKEINKNIRLNPKETQSLAFETQLPNLPVENILLEVEVKDHNKEIISKAYTWVAVKAPFNITLKTEKNAYVSGEKIPVTATIKPIPEKSELQAKTFLVNYKGKILQQTTTDLSSLTSTGKWVFNFTMPEDKSGSQYAWWITTIIMRGADVLAVKRLQVYNNDPWNMRKQMQFSTWSAGTQYGGKPIMELYKDAGFNSLGYQGTPYWAERYGWRRYDEGTGINTFGVTIDYSTFGEVQKNMEKRIAKLNKESVSSRSLALVSLGEESGFKTGWGKRYYWKQNKAPAIPQKVFDDYLKGVYKRNIKKLNSEWGSSFKSFSEIPLTKKYSHGPKVVPISGAAYAKDSKEKDWEIHVNLKDINPKKKYITKTAPYLDSYHFYDWYYQKYCDLATKVFRNNRNPVARTIMSAPGGFYPKVDVYNFHGIGPFYSKERSLTENEIARMNYGDTLGFSSVLWAYFDLYRLWYSELFSYIAASNSHIDYWLDFPLTFNDDVSHTRASFWTKRLRRKMNILEPLLLHKQVYYTPGLGIFTGKQPIPKGLLGKYFSAGISPNTAIYSAFEESGYFPKFIKSDELKKMKVVIASYAEQIKPQEADALKNFVKNGGLLISTPWLASYSLHGNCLSVYPSVKSELKDLLGFRLLNTSQTPNKETFVVNSSNPALFKVSSLRSSKKIKILSSGKDKIIDIKSNVKILEKYPDGSPAILQRSYGKGKIIYFNFVFCWNGWWTTFFKPERKWFRHLIKGILDKDNRIKREIFISYKSYNSKPKKGWTGTKGLNELKNWIPGDSVPYWATTCYSDSSGKYKYFFIFSDHRAPKISSEIELADKKSSVYDIFNGRKLKRKKNGKIKLTLDSGEGIILALTKSPVNKVDINIPETVFPGDELSIRVKLLTKSRLHPKVVGDNAILVETFGPDNRHEELFSLNNRTISNGSGVVKFQIPFNQEAGIYRLKITDVITRKSTIREFKIVSHKNKIQQQLISPFPPDLKQRVVKMSKKAFVKNLRKLRSIYLKQSRGINSKYLLSYFIYVPFIEESRHIIMHRLSKQNWENYIKTIAAAMKRGEYFYLTGEDLGVDPISGLQINSLHPDRSNFINLLAKEPAAKKQNININGRILSVITIGKGKFIYDPISLTQYYMSNEFEDWQRGWLKNIRSNNLYYK